jgi:hypothetical protein
MTTPNTLEIQLGMVGATQIVAQTNVATLATTAAVTLQANYARNPPPAYPTPEAGSAWPNILAFAGTIPAGTTITVFSDEAAALVAAGAASYA